jgi:CBS domain-containing protein
MADMSNLDINELGLGLEDKAGVVSVKQSDTVLKACETLAKASVNAIAVVDDAGALVGNFSASDLKSLYREKLPELTTSVMDFLGAHSKASTEPRAIKANGGTALMDLINATVEQGIRRWWVVNDANEPVGVVSTTDICRVLNSFSYP